MTIALDNPFTVRSVLAETVRRLTLAAAAEPRLTAEWLVAAILNRPRMELYTRLDATLSPTEHALLTAHTERAARHEPVQYILGETEFMGLRIGCDRRALIPRPESEVMAAMIMDDVRAAVPAKYPIVDVGAGTGCIALALASALPQASIIAVDIDESALALARENAERLGLADRVAWRHDDLLTHFHEAPAELVTANLPYIATEDWRKLPAGIRDYEPRRALDGGPHGMDFIERLAIQAFSVLRTEGRLYLEIGADQGVPVQALLASAGFAEVAIHPDWAGRDRIARGVKR